MVIDRWSYGVGWIAHPEEEGRRTSHAVTNEDGSEIWLIDPIDSPGIDDLVGEQGPGTVEGVAVLSENHVRDAESFAEQYDVPVTVPAPLEGAAARIDAAVERVDDSFAGFELRTLDPILSPRETIAYRPFDRTLYVPDFFTTLDALTVGGEKLGMNTISRLRPPRGAFEGLDPARVIVGHGQGVFQDASDALADAIGRARLRYPKALGTQLRTDVRRLLAARG